MKSIRNFFSLLIGIIITNSCLISQQLPISHFNNTTPSIFNPAYWNTDLLNFKYTSENQLFISANKKYFGIEDGPLFISVNYDKYINSKFLLGLSCLSDNFGPYSRKSINARLALAMDLSSISFISGGFNYALNFNNFNSDKIVSRDQNDPILKDNETNFNNSISLGIFYSCILNNKNILYSGMSIQNIVSFWGTKSINALKFYNIPVYTLNIGYSYYFKENYKDLSYIEPSLIIKNAKNISTDIDFGIKYYFWNLISIKPGIRISYKGKVDFNYLDVDLGFNVLQLSKDSHSKFDIRYSFEYPIRRDLSALGSSSEINLNFLF